jgi:deazaflavin-dependent oxidoreductase (nitroreductase family)
MNQKVIEEFRANGGKVGGWFANNTLVLLHNKGAKSGKARINPLVSFEDGDRMVVVASKGGAPTHPDWFHNIVANPEVEVEYETEKFKARAEVTEEPERTRLYEIMETKMASFTEYKQKAGRVIPVVTLTRV